MLVRGDSLAASMSRYLIDEIEKTPNIHVELNSSVTEAHGETRLEAISVHCSASGETNVVPASSLFIFIGAEPKTEWLDGLVERDDKGFILSGPDLKRNGNFLRVGSLPRDPELARNQRARCFRGRRCPPGIGEARRVGRGRRVDCDSIHSPIPGGPMIESQDLRGIAVFSDLPDEQLAWLAHAG